MNMAELRTIAEDSRAAQLVLDTISQGLHRLVINGDANLFVGRLHDSTALLAMFRRDKVSS